MRKRFLNITLALGLVTALLASFAGGVSATPEQPGQNAEYFPMVFNNTTVSGIAGFSSSITVQNVEFYPVNLSFYNANGTALVTNIPVNPRASITYSAASLGVPAGGGGVYATATWDNTALTDCGSTGDSSVKVKSATGPGTTQNVPASYATIVNSVVDTANTNSPVTLRQGTDYNVNIQNAGSANATINLIWLNNAQSANVSGDPLTVYFSTDSSCIGNPRIAGVEKHISADGKSVDGYNAIPVQDFLIAANDPAVYAEPQAALDNSNDWVLPIAQTNTGWNSVIYITNVATEANPFSATFYPAAGQGTMGPSVQLSCTSELNPAGTGNISVLAPGQTCVIDLTAMGAPAGVVGSVWINSTHGTASMVAREKVATNMSLTNVAQPRTDTNYNDYTETGYGSCVGPYDSYTTNGPSTCNSDEYDPAYSVAGRRIAPLVFRDYNGWNTGINISNLSSNWNNVTVEYFNYAGDSVAVDSVNIPPQGMEYVYIPASVNSNVAPYAISSAVITGQYSTAAVVDEVKYLGGAGQGQAMSYAAQNGVEASYCGYNTDNVSTGGYSYSPVYNACYDESGYYSGYNASDQAAGGRVFYSSELALPLFQKGMSGGSTGPTSGINMFNSDPGAPIVGMVTFFNNSGRPVSPSVGPNNQEEPFFIEFGPLTGKTLYAGNYNDLSDNFSGSVLIGANFYNSQGSDVYGYETYGELSAVSNNVDYGVAGDGAAVFNLAPVYHYYYYPYDSCTENCGNYPGSPSGA